MTFFSMINSGILVGSEDTDILFLFILFSDAPVGRGSVDSAQEAEIPRVAVWKTERMLQRLSRGYELFI